MSLFKAFRSWRIDLAVTNTALKIINNQNLPNMKSLLIFTICIVAILSTATAQCSNTSQKIQSPVASKPTEAVAAVSCSNMVLQWHGNADQGYELNITVKDAAGKTLSSGINTSYTRSGGNHYTATIPVTPGTKVSWSLRGISTVEDVLFTAMLYVEKNTRFQHASHQLRAPH